MSIDPKYYTEDVKTIEKIEFCIFTNKEVKSYSAVSNDPFGINISESYQNYEPIKGGLVDLRLGTCDIYLNCLTCGLNNDCPGHFGHTLLAEPVFHYGFLDPLKSILQNICLQCSKPLVEKSEELYKKMLNKKPEQRYKEIKILAKNVNYCYNCGTPVGKIKKEEKESTASIRLILEREIGMQSTDEKTGEVTDTVKKTTKILTPRDCQNILRNLSDMDCFILGFNSKIARPEDLIIEQFPIPPVIIRPTAKIDFMQSLTMEDSLTLKIADIINANKRIRQQIDKEVVSNELSTYNQDIRNLLQLHIVQYFDNENIPLPKSEFKTGNKRIKSISERIKAKQGRVRSNLMGKRVDFSARSVITSDPYINIDEVGVPKNIAMELTIPEEVTPYNITYLSNLVKNGRDEYPGANFVFKTIYKDGKPDIQKIDLKYRKKSIKLNIGDIVERHSINGDYVLFNRQPTLHKPSMMGHKMHVLNNDTTFTFRVNVSVCKPYNADFDGDEMNVHIAQSIQARNELKRIANVKYQIIGAKNSNPIIGCVQDALSGCYLLTKLNTKIKGSDVINFLCNTSSESKNEIDKNKFYTGHEIFSHIIPDGINTTVMKDNKKVLEIINGKLNFGILDKNTLSMVKNSIIHFIWDKYGPNKTRKFIDDSQRLALAYLNYHGFTFGIKDSMIDIKVDTEIKQIINNKILEYNILLTQYENDTDQINTAIIEANLFSNLNAFSSEIGNILIKGLGPENNFFVCIDSKSKGNIMNMQHMMGCVGQKSTEGFRIKKKIENRSLPIFHKDDDTPEARGFIKSSFIDGVNSFEYFYDAMSSREGLIDTAIKSITWETPIIIIENNKPKYIEIGKWIDNLLEQNEESIKHIKKQNMELLDTKNIYIPTTDYNGIVSWGEISAITRHDPGIQLYEIKTLGGRNVTVTESKSLLIWNNKTNQFKEVLTPEIKIGDFVPVTKNLCEPPIIIKEYNKTILDYNYGLQCGKAMIEIPDFIILSPLDFIKGFLETYDKNNISIESLNKLSFILSRNNQIFEDINNKKENNYILQNDVILDKIIEINLIDIKDHPKVYDLTIPKTFNFGLANGLQVRDTAKTGYIQRQLIKGLEDLIIKYDNTNRNAKNVIIQYIYGENGIDQANQTELLISLILLNNKEIESLYGFTKDEIKKLEKEHKLKSFDKTNKSYVDKIKKYRDDLRRIQMISNNNYKILEEKFMLPVNLFRLTQDYSKNKVNTELNPEEILESIEELLNCTEIRLLPGLKDSDTNLLKDDRLLKYLFEISIHDYLCPKKCIFDYGLSKKDFKQLINEIKLNYIKALVHPGEMVGIIAAQSIGEPTSQMSLMKNHKIKLIVKNKKSNKIKLYSNMISTFCDNIINDNPLLTVTLEHSLKNNSTSLETRLTSLETGLTSLETGLTSLETRLTLLETGLTSLETVLTSQEIGLTSLETGLTSQEIGLTSQIGLISLETGLTSQIGLISLETGLTSVETDLTLLKTDLISQETDLTSLENEYYIIGVDSTEKTNWNKISHISRHPVNGQLIKVTTKSGRIVETTLSHSHLIRSNNSVKPIRGSELQLGMRIPVAKYIDNHFVKEHIIINKKEYKLDYLFGWFIGMYLADDKSNNISEYFINNKSIFEKNFNKNTKIIYYDSEHEFEIINRFKHIDLENFITKTCGTEFSKHIPEFAFVAPNKFKAGLIQAYIDKNGNFKNNKLYMQIKAYSKSEQMIKDISLLLNYFDIFSTIKYDVITKIYTIAILSKHSELYKKSIGTLSYDKHLNKIVYYNTKYILSDEIDKIDGLGEIIYNCGEKLNFPEDILNYKIWKNIKTIGRKTIEKYLDMFELNSKKIESELNILRQAVNSNIIWDEIIKIDIYTPDQSEYVYDFTVPLNQTFMIDNGIIVHNTLNTKHSAGVASKSSTNMGVSRIEELLHYSKDIKTPQMTIYFEKEISTDKSKVNKISSYLTHLTIKELITNAKIYYDINSEELQNDKVINPFFINNQKVDLSSLPFVFRIKLNMEKMHDKEITLLDIKTKFISYWTKHFTNFKNMKKNEKDIFTKISRCAILSNIDIENQIIHIRFNMSSFNYNLLTDFLKIVLEHITLKGIDNIKNSDLIEERKLNFTEDGDMEVGKEYVAYTEGINMIKLKYIKGINNTLTTCNDIATIYRLYGIEAVRQILINEFMLTFNSGGGSKEVNHSHMSVLIDMMTHIGSVISIDRHGLNKVDSEPIAKASFEKTMDHFLNAALFNEKDNLHSVSSRIMLGRVIPGGTGAFELMLDTYKLENSEYTKDENGGRITFSALEEEALFKDILKYDFAKNDFFLPI